MSLSTTVPITVGAGGYKFLVDLVDFIAAVKKAGADGWDYKTDTPAVVQACLSELGPHIANFGPILTDLQDKENAGKTLALAALYAVEKLG